MICFSFSTQIHMLNQDVHKNLRRNKSGIHLESVDNPGNNYKRPPGFSLVPTLLGSSVPSGLHTKHKQPAAKSPTTSYYNHIREEMQR